MNTGVSFCRSLILQVSYKINGRPGIPFPYAIDEVAGTAISGVDEALLGEEANIKSIIESAIAELP